jgi:hypothetical protein
MQKALIKQTEWENSNNQFIQNTGRIFSPSFRNCRQKTETENEYFQFLLSKFSLIQIRNRIFYFRKKRKPTLFSDENSGFKSLGFD